MNNLPPCKLCKSEPERSEIINRTAFNCSNSDCSLCDAFLSKDQWIKLHGIVYQDLVEGLRKEFPSDWDFQITILGTDSSLIVITAYRDGKEMARSIRYKPTLDQAIAALSYCVSIVENN